MSNRKIRRLVIGAAAATVVGLFGYSIPALYAKELKLSHFLPPRHTNHTVVMEPWAEEVAKHSNGDLTIRIYPSLQLGGTPAGQYNQVTSGISDISFVTPGYTPTVFPATGIVELPYLTKDAQHATRILHTLFDDYLAPEYKDVKVITLWTVDNFVIQSRTPIRKLDDMDGLKIRTPSSTQSDFIRALGAVPVNMPITKVYTSLERGVIDAFYAGTSAVFSFKLIEVVDYYTTGLGGANLPLTLLMNRKSWDALSAEHKAIIEETSGLKLGLRGAKAYDDQYGRGLEAARKRPGVEIIALPESEEAKVRKAAAPMIEGWIAARENEGIKARAMYKAAQAVE